jgi:hypothetical protein
MPVSLLETVQYNTRQSENSLFGDKAAAHAGQGHGSASARCPNLMRKRWDGDHRLDGFWSCILHHLEFSSDGRSFANLPVPVDGVVDS